MITLWKTFLAGGVAILAMTHQAGAADVKPALYTAAQAEHGANVYQQSCAACHGNLLEGVAAPALKGSTFNEMAKAQSLTIEGLLAVVANTMPQSDPGSLKPEQVNAVVAYILQQNTYPAGATALTPDTAAQAHLSLAAGDTKGAEGTKADTRTDRDGAAKKIGSTKAKAKAKVHHKAKRPM